jgi:hypothetical protein
MRSIVQTAVAAAVAALVVAVGAPASEQLKGPGTIRITGREVADHRVDVGKQGLSAGDVEIMRGLLYNTRITPKPLGHVEMVCTFTVKTSRNCNGTYFLPEGKIVISGPMFFRDLFEVAVVGGTGLYDNVRGSLTVTSLGKDPRRDLLVFRLNV